jgi:hypothetical protein
MGRPLARDLISAPTRWLIAFDRVAASWWSNLIACGHYKHVRALGYIYDLDAFVFYDVQLRGTSIQVARGKGAQVLMAEWAADADVLAIDAGCAFGQKFGFGCFRPLICTTAVAHLLGLPGALRPDALYRQCLAHGAYPVGDARHGPVHSLDQRPGGVNGCAQDPGAAA